VLNIGTRPTFGGTREVVEVHLLDFAGDLYRTEMTVELMARIRSEQKFDGIDELVAQIEDDVQTARTALEGHL
jgi:riboflavin kinase/FMN adenylyltransferase